MSVKKTNKGLSDRDLLLKCVDLVFNKNKLSDQELLLKCVELISNKSKVHHLNDIIIESQRLFDFIKKHEK